MRVELRSVHAFPAKTKAPPAKAVATARHVPAVVIAPTPVAVSITGGIANLNVAANAGCTVTMKSAAATAVGSLMFGGLERCAALSVALGVPPAVLTQTFHTSWIAGVDVLTPNAGSASAAGAAKTTAVT